MRSFAWPARPPPVPEDPADESEVAPLSMFAVLALPRPVLFTCIAVVNSYALQVSCSCKCMYLTLELPSVHGAVISHGGMEGTHGHKLRSERKCLHIHDGSDGVAQLNGEHFRGLFGL
jgi:hypothetical protein